MFNLATSLIAACLIAGQAPEPDADIAIIIDDIGYDYANGRDAVELNHLFAYAVLPFSPYAKDLARLANRLGKNVIVHLPMEADSHNHALGPGALLMEMSELEIGTAVSNSVAAVPYAVGINNHMGSRMTRETDAMTWLMRAIHEHGKLFFVDSRTTSDSVAFRSALAADVAATKRDVFIDNVKSRDAIEQQLSVLIDRARTNGHALGIAHPHAVTVDVLRSWQPEESGVRIIPLEQYVVNYRRDSDGRNINTPEKLSGPASATECGDEREHASATKYPDAPGQRTKHP